MRSLGGQWIYNKEYRSLEQDMETLIAVTPGSMRELMKKYPFDPMTIVTLGPAEKKE
jgi:predicted Zn-dependent peptidase